MRTTVRLDEQLLREAKQYALETGCTLTKLLEQSLRETLARSKHRPKSRQVTLKTTGGTGLQPGVDLDDSASLLDFMEEPHDPERH